MTRQGILKGFFGLGLLLGALLMGLSLAFRFEALPDLADLLPSSTAAFSISDKNSPLNLKNPWATYPWVDRIGMAQVDDQTLTFIEVNSSEGARIYLDSLRADGELLSEVRATRSLWSTVSCYPSSQHPCFTWFGDLLVLAPNEEILVTLQKISAGEEESLKSSPHYQNVESRLASWQGGFVYFDLQKQLAHYAPDFQTLEPLLALFPAFAASFQEKNGTWEAESFLAVDKTLVDDTAYWHPTEKYEATFLPWTPGTLAIEWGGRDSAAQVQQMQSLLIKRSPELADLFVSELENRLEKLFGSMELGELLPLFTGELYFAFTPGTDFLLLTQLDSDEEIQTVLSLKEQFAAHYLARKTFSLDTGEIQARFIPVSQETGQHQNYQYYSFTAEGEEVVTLILTEQLAILSKKQQTAFDVLDRIKGETPPRPIESFKTLLDGSNEVWTVHCKLLPDGSILKSLLADLDTITSARKLFDDGIVERSTLTISHD